MANGTIGNKLWSACNKMRQDPGTTGALQYIEQFSWLLFLKVYEEIESEYEAKAAFEKKNYKRNIDGEYRWSAWTGKEKYLTGLDLLDFVRGKIVEKDGEKIEHGLFPYLRNLSGNRSKEIISEIFKNTQNRMEDGYRLREVIDIIAETEFFGSQDSFAVSNIYEGLFSRMKSAELKPLAEFYTPRVIARFMTEMVKPRVGETVYDPANGPSGFLVEAYHYIKQKITSVSDHEKLHKNTFYGREVKPFPFILGMMNMVLNGIAEPNIVKGNTLSLNLFNITESDRYDLILTNPPFSGSLRGVDSNFPYPSAATEILFLQHCMRSLKSEGKCAIIVPDGVLFEVDDKAYVNTRKELVENFNLHTIIRLPKGAFAPYAKDVSTNILFFEKKGVTKDIWYYEIPLGKNQKSFSKSKPIKYEHFEECINLFLQRKIATSSWVIKKEDVASNDYNLDIVNPNKQKEFQIISIKELIDSFEAKKLKVQNILLEFDAELRRVTKRESLTKIPLENLIIESKETNGEGRNLPVCGVNNVTGIKLTIDKKIGDIKKYKIIKKNYLAYNPYRINVGSIGLYEDDHEGIVSPAYVVFTTNQERLLPRFLLIFIKNAEGQHEIRKKTKGSVRSSLKFERLQKIEIPDLSIPEQKIAIERIEKLKTSLVSLEKIEEELLGEVNRAPVESF